MRLVQLRGASREDVDLRGTQRKGVHCCHQSRETVHRGEGWLAVTETEEKESVPGKHSVIPNSSSNGLLVVDVLGVESAL